MLPSLNLILTRITMYRLMLYYLILLVIAAIVLSLIGLLPHNPFDILFTTLYLVGICFVSNQILAKLFRATPNVESQYISALILALIIGPVSLVSNILFPTVAAVAAMASKYILAWRKRHIFNPAAFGVLITALLLGESASWWVGSLYLFPLILLGGIVVANKIKRWHLIGSFLLTYFVLFTIIMLMSSADIPGTLSNFFSLLTNSAIPFFLFVMLVEPNTAPADRRLRVYYGAVIALVLILYQTLSALPFTLELALLTGNIVARLMRSDPRYSLVLKEKHDIAAHTKSFIFEPEQKIPFMAGQFLEWTLAHPHPDSRGVRRYFTIASSPTEPHIMLATKLAEKPSSFKSTLFAMKPGDVIYASHLEGEFTLPRTDQGCVFIAGGIGITPFRSMITSMIDSKLSRPITLLYSNKTAEEIAFQELFKEAEKAFGLKTVYTITDNVPSDWKGRTGFIDATMIKEEVPDYLKRIFYISGPEPMVQAFEKLLAEMGVTRKNIKRDFFPGYTETYQQTK